MKSIESLSNQPMFKPKKNVEEIGKGGAEDIEKSEKKVNQEAEVEELEATKIEEQKIISQANLIKNYSGFNDLDPFLQESMIQGNLETSDIKEIIFFLRKERKEIKSEMGKEEKNNVLKSNRIREINKLIIAARCSLMVRDTELKGFEGGISVSRKENKNEQIKDDVAVLKQFLKILKDEFLGNRNILRTEVEKILRQYEGVLRKVLKKSEYGELQLNREPIQEKLSDLLKGDEFKD
ncbi:MAG: hypothetical protein ABIE46_00225 [Patescibacteria group bacterium]|nr:hypothetical protein [Patescibacteria group bacterium]